MSVLPLVIAVNLALSLGHVAEPMASVENEVLAELNQARTNPAAYARELRTARGFYRGKLLAPPGAGTTYVTQEGVAPVDEAISFVSRTRSRAPLSPAPVLAAAAADHRADQHLAGFVGHVGRDGSTPAERVRRRGGGAYVGEVIAYGSTSPADIVRQFVVDDGVADRGHRRLLFDPSLRYAGVACGGHRVYRYMCVITLGRTPTGRALHAETTRRS